MDAMNRPLSTKATAAVLIFLAIAFFFCRHNFQNFQSFSEGKYEVSADFIEGKEIEGNFPRRVALFTLVLFSLILLKTKRPDAPALHGPLAWVLLFFAVWSCASIAWSIDAAMTVRRLLVFAAICLAAFAMAVSFPIRFLPLCVFVVTTLYLCLGLSVEVFSGTFQPLAEDYRFSGTVHPNIQGINCALMFLAAISLSKSSEDGRIFFLVAALVAFLALILTKSRTAFGSVLIAQTVFFVASSRKSRVAYYILGFCCLLVFLYLCWSDSFESMMMRAAFLGRDSEEISTLTGRTFLWEESIASVLERPFLGYGFHGFWVPGQIRQFSTIVGIGINNAHSAYLDVLLGIGLVGLVLYISILCLGIKNAFTYYRNTQDTRYGFLSILLIFCVIHGLLESEVIDFSSFQSFVLIWGLFLLVFHTPPEETPLRA
jgi:O-antigen ligase